MGNAGHILLWLVLAFLAAPAWADVPNAQRAEVEHLLAFIETSGCDMERNGKRHPPDEARAHVARKYAHYKGRITRTEQFIELAATGSTMTGKPYMAVCPEEAPVPTANWLLEELRRLREEAAP